MFPRFTCFGDREIAVAWVILCQLDAGSCKMSDAKGASMMDEEGANEEQGLSTVILRESKCSCISVLPKTSASLHRLPAL